LLRVKTSREAGKVYEKLRLGSGESNKQTNRQKTKAKTKKKNKKNRGNVPEKPPGGWG